MNTIDNLNLQVGKRTYDLDELTDNLVYFPGERTADFFNELGLQVARDLRIKALRDSIRPHLNNPHQLEKLTMDMKYKLGWFENFSEFQLLNLISYLNDDNINRNYKKNLWTKLLEFIIEQRVPEKTTIRLFKMAYDIGASRKKYLEKISEFNKKIDSIFVDDKDYIDGLLPDTFRPILYESSTTNEIRALGKKYGVDVPRRLRKQELIDIMISELKDRGDYTKEIEEELNSYNIIKLERYCINNEIKASTQLKKEEVIEYILKNAKETMHTYYVPDNPGIYHIIEPEEVKEADYFGILDITLNVDEEKELVIQTNLENPEIKFTNYDNKLILITEDNTIKGLKEGETSVKAVISKSLGLQTIFNVNVKMDVFISAVSNINLKELETYNLEYETNDKAGVEITSLNEEIIKVEGQVLTALNEGNTKVLITSKSKPEIIREVNINIDRLITVDAVSDITLNPKEIHKLEVITNDPLGVMIENINKEVISIDSDNLITGLKAGNSKLILTSNSDNSIQKEVNVVVLSPLFLHTPNTSYKLTVEDKLELEYDTNASLVTLKDYDENIINVTEDNEIIAVNPGLTKVNMYLEDMETPYKELIIVVEEKMISYAEYNSLLHELMIIKGRLEYLEEDKASKVENDIILDKIDKKEELLNEKIELLNQKIEELNYGHFAQQLDNFYKENRILYEEIEALKEKIANIKVEPDIIKQFIFDNEGVNYLEDDIKGFYTNVELIDSMIDNLEDLHTFIMDLYNRLLLTENDIKLVKDLLGANISLSMKDLKDLENDED